MAVAAPPGVEFMTDAVAHWAAVQPDAEALAYGEVRWTWARWDDRIRRVAGGLAARGLGRGGRVAFASGAAPGAGGVARAELRPGLRPDRAGEFWFRPAQQMMGYLNKPDDTARAITEDGWLRSGDIGHVGDGGFLFVCDRVKDMIITGGENVYSPEVEQAVAGHPAVAGVAVIGVPDDHWGETVKAMVVLRPGQQATGQEIIGFTRERLAHYKCPRTVDIIDALPRNPSGKVLKRALRAPYREGRDRQI